MDEPLSNLDAALRVQTRAEILKLQKRLGTTTIYVTHDQVEAMTMGDRIAVMRKGILQQIGTPEELYTRPANIFVATFIGSPSMNLLPAETLAVGGAGELAGFRPEHIRLGQTVQTRSGSTRRWKSSSTSATSNSPICDSERKRSWRSSRSSHASRPELAARSPSRATGSRCST